MVLFRRITYSFFLIALIQQLFHESIAQKLILEEEDFNVGDNVIVTNVSGLKVTVTKKDGKNGN